MDESKQAAQMRIWEDSEFDAGFLSSSSYPTYLGILLGILTITSQRYGKMIVDKVV